MPSVGDRVGRFRITGTLGSGGMGIVFEAHDPDLQRTVALKLLKPGAGSQNPVDDGLLSEARAAARLSHPNVVSVYEAGFHRGHPFIVMERVDGPNLAKWVRETPRTWQQALRVLIGAARGLDAAHRAGLVHRDIKPQNILVDEDRARITDFGIARTLEQLRGPLLVREMDGGGSPGTPAYMSPEQRRGGMLDGRADQYAFALTAIRVLRQTTPAPRWVRMALERAKAPLPEDRYPDMGALVGALDRLDHRRLMVGGVVGGGLVAVAVALFPLLRPSCPDPSAQFDLQGTAMIAQRVGATGFAAEAWSRVSSLLGDYRGQWAAQWRASCEATRVERIQSPEAFERRRACLDRHRRTVEASVLALSEVESPSEIAQRAVALSDRLPWLSDCEDATLLMGTAEPLTDPEKRAELVRLEAQMARVESLIDGDEVDAAAQLAPALEAAALELGHAPALARARMIAGLALVANGAYVEGEDALRSAAQLATEIGMDRLAASAWIWLIQALDRSGHPREALALEDPTAALLVRAGLGPQYKLRMVLHTAVARYHLGQHEEAKAELEAAIALVEPVAAEQAQDELSRAYATLGLVQTKVGEVDAALKAFETARRVRLEAWGGAEHPFLAVVASHEAIAYLAQRRLELALEKYQVALQHRRRSLPEDHPKIAVALSNIGRLLADMGRVEEARSYLEQALELKRRRLGAHHPALVPTLNAMGLLFWSPDGYDAARSYHEQALDIAKLTSGSDSGLVGTTLEHLAGTYLEEGRFDDAVPLFRRSLRIGQATQSGQKASLHYRMYGLGLALLETGQLREGAALTDEAAAIEKGPNDAISRAEQLAASALADHLRGRGGGEKLAAALADCPERELRCRMLRKNIRRWGRKHGLKAARHPSRSGATSKRSP